MKLKDAYSLDALEKDPRPGPLFEGNPVGEGTTRRGLVGCHLWGLTESDTTDAT